MILLPRRGFPARRALTPRIAALLYPPRAAPSRRPSLALLSLIVLALVVSGMTLSTNGQDPSQASTAPSLSLFGAVLPKAAEEVPQALGVSLRADRLGFWSKGSAQKRAANLLATMGPEEVLGQVFLLGFPGDRPPTLLYDWIERRGIGGVKIFGWNTEDSGRLAEAVAALQAVALANGPGIPLLIATDQEGGIVRHVKGATSETPGNMAIGASGRPSDAYWSGYYIARELDAVGVNMNFAPAVDLASSPRSSLIGVRSFSSDPLEAGLLGAALSAGTMAAGLIPTAKHFPGHGGTDLDSHGVLPRIDIGADTLWNRELVPFRMLVGEGLPAVMSGHLSFPRIDPSGAPASLSKYFLTDLLRGRLGFKGVVVTDDLRMGGAPGSFASNCKKALEAGDDLLMSSILPDLDDEAWTTLLASYENDANFRSRVREAAARVLALKLEWLAPRGMSALVPKA